MTKTQTPRIARPSTHELVEVDEITGAFVTQITHGSLRKMERALMESLEDEGNDCTGTRVEIWELTEEALEEMQGL